MKRFRLPKGAKAAIRAWLALPTFKEIGLGQMNYKEGVCPFTGSDVATHIPCKDICQRMFPSTVREGLHHCPCQVLTLNYVIRRAKEIIR